MHSFRRHLAPSVCLSAGWEALGISPEPQESITAETHHFLTRATKRLFMCVVQWLIKFQRVMRGSRHSPCGRGWETVLLASQVSALQSMLRPGAGWGGRLSRSENPRRDLWATESHQTKPSVPVFIFISHCVFYICNIFFFKKKCFQSHKALQY